MKKYFLLLLLFCFCSLIVLGQNTNRFIDSLLLKLKTAKQDTVKVDILNNLSNRLIKIGDYEKALQYTDSIFVLSEQLKFKKGKAQAYLALGLIQFNKGNYPEALHNFETALKISEEVMDKQGIGNYYVYSGMIYSNQGKFLDALKNSETALMIMKEIGDKDGMADSYNNLGLIYMGQSNYSEALKNHLLALRIGKEIGNKPGISQSYNNIGIVYVRQGNYVEALKNYQASLKIKEEIGDKRGIAASLTNIGTIYRAQGNYSEALKSHFEALKIREEIGNKQGIASSYNSIGVIYKDQGNYDEALKSLLIALKIREEIGIKPGVAATYNNIGNLYQDKNNYREALKNHQTALRIGEEVGDKPGVVIYCISVGADFSKLTDFKKDSVTKTEFSEALQYLHKGLELAKEIGANESIREACKNLSDVYVKMEDYQTALRYNRLYTEIKDSLLNNETTRKLEQLRTQYEVERAVNNEKADKEKAIEIEKLKYLFALREEKTAEEKRLAEQKFENEKNLATQNALHQQQLSDEKAKQAIKDAEAKTLLEKEKAEKKRKSELYITLLSIIGLASIFVIILIRQRNLKRRAVDKAETGHKMAELELQSLRAQLNPHFMFNSLNAIQDLIVNENNDKSHLYLSRFSKLLRMLLDNANQPFVSVKQEIEFLELYLSLENLRIPDLQFSIEKDSKINTEERMIPNMMLQPYIENAIWHGLSNKKGNRKLQIRIHENGNATEFEIEDNGIGRKKAAELKKLYRQGHHSKGMELLSKRFSLLSKEYGAAIQTTVTDLGNGEATGTLVKIGVPFTLSEQAKQLAHDTNHNN